MVLPNPPYFSIAAFTGENDKDRLKFKGILQTRFNGACMVEAQNKLAQNL